MSQAHLDQWVVSEADRFRRAAPRGVVPRMSVEPGANTMNAFFDGATSDAVLAACKRTVDAYLPKAPRMPIVGTGSAAHVVIPCRPCP